MDNSELADIPHVAHTRELEDTPLAGDHKQEEEEEAADEHSRRVHTQRRDLHKLLLPVVHNREHCYSVVVGTADHSAVGNTLRTASHNVPGEAWSCSLRKDTAGMDPVGHAADTLALIHGHHSVAGV